MTLVFQLKNTSKKMVERKCEESVSDFNLGLKPLFISEGYFYEGPKTKSRGSTEDCKGFVGDK